MSLPLSLVIPTRHRPGAIKRMLGTLENQDQLPAELIVVDASDDRATQQIMIEFARKTNGSCSVRWMSASVPGAASQRNQGVAASTQSVIGFCDDDILFELGCLDRLWAALSSAPDVGGVSATITNQKFYPPGLASRIMYWFLDGDRESCAGRVLGGAVNLLPEDREELPDMVPVEWMNLGCTLYRKDALPDPPFSSQFTGYSMMEDLTLSLIVSQRWRLLNARTARIFHDSQPGSHKADPVAMARMETVNRHYVMTKVLGQTLPLDYGRMLLWQAFSLLASLRSQGGRRDLLPNLLGRLQGWREILR